MMAVSSGFAKKPNPLERFEPVPANEQIPIVDFFRPRLFTAPELNPAGTHFAALVTGTDDRRQMLTLDLATSKIEGLRGVGGQDIYAYEWLNDSRLLISLMSEKKYAVGMFVAEVGRLSSAYVIERYNVIQPIGFPRRDPLRPIVWIRHNAFDDGQDGGVVRIDSSRKLREDFTSAVRVEPRSLKNGTLASIVDTLPVPQGGMPVGYLADKDGELAFGFTAAAGVNSLHRFTGRGWEKCPVDLDVIDVVAAGDQPGELIVLGPRQEGKPRALQRMNAATGELGDVLLQDDRYDFNAGIVKRHPVDGHAIGIYFHRSRPQTVWFERRYEAFQMLIERYLPDAVVHIVGSDLAEKRFFVEAFSDVKPLTYYRVDFENRSLGLVKNVAPWIDSARMRPMKVISFPSRDGATLEGYLTMPAGASKEKPPPLVVLPHGGPWVRDVWGWDGEVQFLASRGYAVFQPNYRGSSGYDWKFSPDDQWAFRKMHDDVTDGVKALIKWGQVDPARIAIMGSSFGGYLSLCGAAYEPDLYRCAVTIAGVFDWERVMRESRNDEHVRGRFQFLRRRLGDPQAEAEKFDAISPLRHIDQVKIPVFVAHGREDHVASVSQSKRLIGELQKNRVPYVSHFESTEGHGMASLKNRVELYTDIEEFLAKYVPAAAGS